MNSIDTELIEAAKENNVPEVRRLLSVGADIEAKDSIYGGTPLHNASYKDHVQVVQALREHGADIEAKTHAGETPLHFACSIGHSAVVIELIGPNDNQGATTSILGKRKSPTGADIDAKDNYGNTPLQFAIFGGHLAVVMALVSGGANILAANDYGQLPIEYAVSRGRSAVSKCLLQQMYATTPRYPLHQLLKDLSWIGNPNINIGNPDSSGGDVPPLRYALWEDMLGADDVVEILEYLVDQNPPLLSRCDQDGALPLHVACRRGVSFPIVQSLVNLYKASVKSVTPQGDLPLFLACEMPETPLDTIFLLMKLYPDLVYR
jgi:ankyrin repeat protein